MGERGAALGVGLLVLGSWTSSCGERPAGGAPDAPALLAKVSSLADHHRVVEALRALEAAYPGALGAQELRAEERALFERWAQLLLTASRPADALEVLDALRRSGPLPPDARRLLARALGACGHWQRALAAFAELDAETIQAARLPIARAVLDSGRAHDAAAWLAAALISDPWEDEAYLLLGRALVAMDQADKATVFLDRYRRQEPFRLCEELAVSDEFGRRPAHANLRRGNCEEERGRLFEAMEEYRRALARDRNLGHAYLALARLAVFLERPHEAIGWLERLPREPALLEVLADAYEAAGEPSKALRTLEEASALEPGRVELAERMAALVEPRPLVGRERRLATVRARVRAASRGVPLSRCVSPLLELAGAYREAAEVEPARRLALLLVRLAPDIPAVRRTAAECFDRPEDLFIRLWIVRTMQESDHAIDTAMAALGLSPDTVRAALAGRPPTVASGD